MRIDLRAALLAGCLALAPIAGGAQTLERSDADLLTAQDLADLCSANGTDIGSEKARILCHGFIVGAMHFHRAVTEQGDFQPLACPDATITRREMAVVFVSWSGDRADLATMRPLEGLVRAAQAEWPCAQ